LRTNLNHILFIISVLSLGIQTNYAQEKTSKESETLTKHVKQDSIHNDSLVNLINKEAIDAIIDHSAEDYIIENVIRKRVTLYNKAVINYNDITIKAGKITIDYHTNMVIAKGIKDSIGLYSQLPFFKQGGEESTQDSLVFNFKNEKAIIYGIKTEQSGIITLGEKTKKVNDSTIFIRNIRFTTSDKENPDYYLATKKAKIVPNKKIIIGPTNLVIADVPTPILFPFAYFPLTTTRSSGFIVPTYGESNNQGFFLQNGGYYFAGNDYFDLTVLGDIYSNSSWGINTQSSYKRRYRYAGGISFRYENLIYGIQGFDNYSKRKNYNLRWSHSQDAKSNPNSRFSASVNLGSSKYYKESLNQLNNAQTLTNTLSSSISYYKKFVGTPFSLSASASHSQNTNTEIISMSLPSLQLNMDRIYPFAPKSGSKKNALQKMGLTYTLKGQNRIVTTDDEFMSKKMFQEAKSGIHQKISLSTNMKLLKYLTFSPSVNYKEIWYFKSIDKNYDQDIQEIVKDTINSFSTFREYSTSASISTIIYGMFNFKGNRLKAIRHTIKPSISLNYKPDFSFYYEDVQQSADPSDLISYSKFENGIYGSPSKGLSKSIGLSIANTLEAKVKEKDATDDKAYKKISLINNLNIRTRYNFAADSLRMSPVELNAGTNLFKKKLRVNMGASLDPYALNANGQRYNTLNIHNNGSLFRLTRANLSINYSISSKDFKKDKGSKSKQKKAPKMNNEQDTDFFSDDSINPFENTPLQTADKKTKKEEVTLYQNSMPWSLRLSYKSTYSNRNRQNEISGNSLTFSGDIKLTPKWKVGGSSGYDFKNRGFTYTRLHFSRDLDSWKINFDWVPFGSRASYYFFIGVKSSMLSDLKWEKRSPPVRRIF